MAGQVKSKAKKSNEESCTSYITLVATRIRAVIRSFFLLFFRIEEKLCYDWMRGHDGVSKLQGIS